jgi:malate dehydrogenase (oxaloacetate-decarboxylating)(NADP+)
VARKPIIDRERYCDSLRARLDPTASRMQLIIDRVRAHPKRMVFAEGEEEKTIRAALAWRNQGLGTPILIGREERVHETLAAMGINQAPEGVEIHNARLSARNTEYADFLYRRAQRRGMLFRDCQRQVNQDRNVFGAAMVAHGDADAMVTGLTRNYTSVLRDVLKVIDPKSGERVFGLTIMVARGRTVFIADTAVHELPDRIELADIAIQTARTARRMGFTPRVAFLSFSTFGNRRVERAMRVQDAVEELDQRNVDFEYDGEMSVDVALDPELLALYPFCRLSAPANVLIMPALHTAHISSRLLQQLGGGTVIGPVLLGLSKPVQILPMNASVSDMLNLAALAAYDAIEDQAEQMAQAAE